ncbi:MAG TPA: aromatic-ring-hydroxylating dioxygenase subunit beta [Rhodopila sp.]|nr:aromatic-ring-hydroxylating dioxygenase subunit beta [Rhodopila sp.]
MSGESDVAAFLFHEARLLDQRRWQDWLGLFAEGGMYWAPLTFDQPDPITHVSLFYEDALLREVRAQRLEEKRAWSQQPVTQAARIVGNILLLPEQEGDIVVASTFHMLEWRRNGHRMLGGQYTHRLRRTADGFRIVLKRIDLINRQDVQDTLETFL